MGAETRIGWTDHTLNWWMGCAKVSPGCAFCYAEHSQPVRVVRAAGRPASKANPVALAPVELWGPRASRLEVESAPKNLRAWYRAAVRDGAQRRVFVQSVSDTFEDRDDACVIRADRSRVTLDVMRHELFAAIHECDPIIGGPPLIFQLLTKRPENVFRMAPASWLRNWPAHVWIGATCEDQQRAEERLTHLLALPAPVRFVSVEPMLGPVDLRPWLGDRILCDDERCMARHDHGAGLVWVIVGGESAQGGHDARPFDLAWARSLRDQCRAAGVPFFLKQLGSRSRGHVFAAAHDLSPMLSHALVTPGLITPPGHDESEWPADLRGLRAFPEAAPPDAARVYSVPGREGTLADVEAGLRQAAASEELGGEP